MNDLMTARLITLRRRGSICCGLALIACLVGAFLNMRQFFVSYLVAYTFWLGLSLGCLGVAMIHYLTGGNWGFVTRRILEAGFMTLPLMAVFFIPIFFGLHELYPWARPDAVHASEPLAQRRAYMNLPMFFVRAVLFIGVWLVMAFYLRKCSLEQDTTQEPAPTIRMRALSGPGIVIYPLAATFAFVDWIMSVESEWHSTIFPLILLIGQILTALAFITLALAQFRHHSTFQNVLTRKHFHDLGNLLLAFVVFWTYVSFSQLLIIYSGNLPREIDWYLHRTAGGWKWVVGFLALFHFFIPFFLLLFRVMKQSVTRLAIIAGMIFCVHIVEVYWVIEPSYFPNGVHVHWLDFAAVLGMGSAWFAVFARNLSRHNLLPQNDPRIEYTFAQPANAK